MMVLKTKFARRVITVLIRRLRIEEKNIDPEELKFAINDYYSNLPRYKRY